jgi:tetrahydromethanopterin S-methyltransferase subunit F
MSSEFFNFSWRTSGIALAVVSTVMLVIVLFHVTPFAIVSIS